VGSHYDPGWYCQEFERDDEEYCNKKCIQQLLVSNVCQMSSLQTVIGEMVLVLLHRWGVYYECSDLQHNCIVRLVGEWQVQVPLILHRLCSF
jgi:hypothetical protein